MSDAYITSEVNALAAESPSILWIPGNNCVASKEVRILRVLLIGGPPHGTPATAHMTLLKAMAAMPSVDFDDYDVLGVTLIEVPPGVVLEDQGWTDHTTGDNSYVADLVVKIRADNCYWFDRSKHEQKLRAGLATWGGGYSPAVSLMALTTDDPNVRITGACEFWRQQPSLFVVTSGQEPTPQIAYSSKVNSGTLGVGFSTGLADYPGRCVPLKWSSQLVTPQPGGGGGAQIPVIVPPGTTQPAQPGTAPPAGKLSQTEALAVFGACGVAGYLLYKRFAGG